mmetsp:Transcript_14408/g.28124  ORF Transcript_14408/g.28124 Transcript_14408/m.28124 type:complete len:935 (+) Transcript_14408:33-2837(+)
MDLLSKMMMQMSNMENRLKQLDKKLDKHLDNSVAYLELRHVLDKGGSSTDALTNLTEKYWSEYRLISGFEPPQPDQLKPSHPPTIDASGETGETSQTNSYLISIMSMQQKIYKTVRGFDANSDLTLMVQQLTSNIEELRYEMMNSLATSSQTKTIFDLCFVLDIVNSLPENIFQSLSDACKHWSRQEYGVHFAFVCMLPKGDRYSLEICDFTDDTEGFSERLAILSEQVYESKSSTWHQLAWDRAFDKAASLSWHRSKANESVVLVVGNEPEEIVGHLHDRIVKKLDFASFIAIGTEEVPVEEMPHIKLNELFNPKETGLFKMLKDWRAAKDIEAAKLEGEKLAIEESIDTIMLSQSQPQSSALQDIRSKSTRKLKLADQFLKAMLELNYLAIPSLFFLTTPKPLLTGTNTKQNGETVETSGRQIIFCCQGDPNKARCSPTYEHQQGISGYNLKATSWFKQAAGYLACIAPLLNGQCEARKSPTFGVPLAPNGLQNCRADFPSSDEFNYELDANGQISEDSAASFKAILSSLKGLLQDECGVRFADEGRIGGLRPVMDTPSGTDSRGQPFHPTTIWVCDNHFEAVSVTKKPSSPREVQVTIQASFELTQKKGFTESLRNELAWQCGVRSNMVGIRSIQAGSIKLNLLLHDDWKMERSAAEAARLFKNLVGQQLCSRSLEVASVKRNDKLRWAFEELMVGPNQLDTNAVGRLILQTQQDVQVFFKPCCKSEMGDLVYERIAPSSRQKSCRRQLMNIMSALKTVLSLYATSLKKQELDAKEVKLLRRACRKISNAQSALDQHIELTPSPAQKAALNTHHYHNTVQHVYHTAKSGDLEPGKPVELPRIEEQQNQLVSRSVGVQVTYPVLCCDEKYFSTPPRQPRASSAQPKRRPRTVSPRPAKFFESGKEFYVQQYKAHLPGVVPRSPDRTGGYWQG